MRFLASALLLTLLAVPAAAQPWYARGEFNAWGLDIPMVVDPEDATHFTADITGFESYPYNWKIAEEDYNPELPGIGPGNDGRLYTNTAGQARLHLYDQTTWDDGYYPTSVRRVGYDDHDQFDWEIVGSFNGWPGAFDSAYTLTDMGDGRHVGTFAMPAGPQEFKFRGLVPEGLPPTPPAYSVWDTNIGQFFRNSSGNNVVPVGTAGDLWTFELDLPKGRFRYFTDAEPVGQEGDFNKNGIVDAADYTVWRDNLGSNTPLDNDPNGAPVGPASYETWKAHYGQGTLLTWFARNTAIAPQTQLPDQNLVGLGGGNYELNYTGLTAGDNYDFEVKKTDLSESLPSNPMRVRANAAGEIGLKFYELQSASWGDGWSPSNVDRVGYEDPEQFGWDIIGQFPESNWSVPLFSLTPQGDGVYAGSYTMTAAGNFGFKFRHQGDEANPWNISIGGDFANNAANADVTVANIGDVWHFELDLPNGRWRVYLDAAGAGAGVVPEPGSLAIALAGLLVGAAAVRRRR